MNLIHSFVNTLHLPPLAFMCSIMAVIANRSFLIPTPTPTFRPHTLTQSNPLDYLIIRIITTKASLSRIVSIDAPHIWF